MKYVEGAGTVFLPAKGGELCIEFGDYFNLRLPDGRLFNVECTADDFSIVRAAGDVDAYKTGLVAYTCAVSRAAKMEESGRTVTTGYD